MIYAEAVGAMERQRASVTRGDGRVFILGDFGRRIADQQGQLPTRADKQAEDWYIVDVIVTSDGIPTPYVENDDDKDWSWLNEPGSWRG